MGSLKKYRIATLILALLAFIELIALIYFWKARAIKIPPPVAFKGKIAIVLDDWGYNLNNLELLGEIKYPLTISLLPHLPYANTIAQDAKKKGLEVILHLPMEPKEKYRLEKHTILTSMDESTIRKIIDGALTSVGTVKGVSNHMGSKATEDLRMMSIVFKELKRRGIYFLDSMVSSDSVGLDLAHKMHVGFARRDVFIDNESNPLYIRAQIYKLKTRARIYGQAIGIGHDRKNTLEVLKEVMPELEKEGYKFVLVSELVR